MVRERQSTRRSRTKTPRAKARSIWDTPHLRQILSEPVGTPMKLTKAEARAIIQEHLENPGPYDAEKADRAIRDLRKIRRESGALLIRPDRDD